ncbi:hypothetical protein GGQ88_001364 [Novosphingobium hassiacum]|uniref:Uncharacterized protein n=1 Tax=Novosphingobium hassiacum TaxID=173676 RepID=A0A7W6EVB1_9SPHN|nr:hypothetical protein [Novosphingobium hassiacum]MBB3860103.1 hypothetical protein [Novosphingobium hassiacum]
MALAVLLASCSTEEEKPGGVSKDEAAALDAAAEMLDQRELPDLPEASAQPAQPPQPAPAPSAS